VPTGAVEENSSVEVRVSAHCERRRLETETGGKGGRRYWNSGYAPHVVAHRSPGVNSLPGGDWGRCVDGGVLRDARYRSSCYRCWPMKNQWSLR